MRNNIQGGIALISGSIPWSSTPAISPDFQSGIYTEYCRDFSTFSVNVIIFWATVHTNTGEVFQIGSPVEIIDCDVALTMSSDAAQFCPTDNSSNFTTNTVHRICFSNK